MMCSILSIAWPARAETRLQRVLDSDRGLEVEDVRSLVEDHRGFLWIGTVGGLVRYDGNELSPWARTKITGFVSRLAAGPDELLAAEWDGNLYRIEGREATLQHGPDGQPIQGVKSVAFDDRGHAWVATGSALLERPPGRPWQVVARSDDFAGQSLYVVQPWGAHVLIGTRMGLWRVHRSRRAFDQLARLEHHPTSIQPGPDGGLYLATRDGTLWRHADGVTDKLFWLDGIAHSSVWRGPIWWAAYDRYLVRVEPTDNARAPRIEIIGPADGFVGGGPLLVDRENSLWVGTFLGAVQFPEPDTVALGNGDGLPSSHARFLVRAGEHILVSTWQGVGRIEQTRSGLVAETVTVGNRRINGRLCADAWGRLWVPSASDGSLLEFRARTDSGHELIAHRTSGHGWSGRCASARDGGVWLAASDGIYLTERSGVRAVGRLPTSHNNGQTVEVFENGNGRLFATSYEEVCHTDAEALSAGRSANWQCHTLPGIHHSTDFLPMPSGAVWMTTERGGVWRFADDRWAPIPGSQTLPSRCLQGLARARAGGAWVVGKGVLMRVEERPEHPDGWRVVNRLGGWNGLLTGGASDVLEDLDGSLWLATSAGVVRVPARAVQSEKAPPPIELVHVRANGRPVSPRAAVQLPYGENQLSVSFAALSFRDPDQVRYRMRRLPGGVWSEPTPSRHFQLMELPPGEYRLEGAASIDGTSWRSVATPLVFSVATPWFREPWVWLLGGTGLALILLAVHRARLAVALRLERQRMRIAMDLHDEIGSALASISVLAGLGADGLLNPDEQRAMAGKVADTSAELGECLGDIVWSLRPAAGRVEQWAAHLAQRGANLFPDDRPAFVTRWPTIWPDMELSLPVRRNLQAIAVEALHNAAKHADAAQVELGLAVHGRAWLLWIEDDGRGLPTHPGPRERGSGLGLSSMERRAAEIGARYSIGRSSHPGERPGTRVSVVFDPRAR